MEYREFVDAIREEVTKKVGEEVNVTIEEMPKCNESYKAGLLIRRGEAPIAPAVYLDALYEYYKDGRTMEEIAGWINLMYQEIKDTDPESIEEAVAYKKVKKKILPKLINREKNETLLAQSPHILWEDLAIVFYVLMAEAKDGTITMGVQYPQMKMWGVSTEELYQQAMKNATAILPAELTPMRDVLKGMLRTEDVEAIPNIAYVLSNRLHSFGAACVTYPDVLEMIAEEVEDDFYLVPSSVHEMMILPEHGVIGKDRFRNSIREVNEKILPPEEFLSNHAYFYSREEKKVSQLSV